MNSHTDPCSGRVTYLGTGIGNLAAAKRYLRRKWNRGLPQPIVVRPGARFYVSVRMGRKSAMLLGPYVSHMTAIAAVPRASDLMRKAGHSAFLSIGTASLMVTVPTRFGR